MTRTPVADYLAVELSLPVLMTLVCRGLDFNTQPSAHEANALTNFEESGIPTRPNKSIKELLSAFNSSVTFKTVDYYQYHTLI